MKTSTDLLLAISVLSIVKKKYYMSLIKQIKASKFEDFFPILVDLIKIIIFVFSPPKITQF